MPRLLVISPHFPPVNAPDMQRVRMSLPRWTAAGWGVTVLTVDDRTPSAPLEPELLQTVPSAVRIIRTSVLSRRWTRFIGLNNLGWRALFAIFRTGTQLLRRERFDVVYFSTTQFIVCPLGRFWSERFGVPFVLDLQDPWLSDFYERTGTRPPGGWKYRLAQLNARTLEGWTLRHCAHLISVSPSYIEALAQRHEWFDSNRATTLPFGAPAFDFAIAHRRFAEGHRVLPSAQTNEIRIAYAGRLGADMHGALEILLGAVAKINEDAARYSLHFFGTSYAAAGSGQSTTAALATRHHLPHAVHENPDRIGYLSALQLLLETDVALILGSEDKAYSPSKIFPTLLAGRPTLAIVPHGSQVAALLKELGGATVIEFNRDDSATAQAAVAHALSEISRGNPIAKPVDRARLMARHGADAVADAQLEIFSSVLKDRNFTR